jgi:hypothetical protein
MASPQEVTNRKVADALGMVVIPLAKADCHTHAEGVKYLYAAGERLWHTPMDFIDEYEGGDPWSPATDPADALACLEEWCKVRMMIPASLEFWPSRGEWLLWFDGRGPFCGNFCEAICQAIINAEAGK